MAPTAPTPPTGPGALGGLRVLDLSAGPARFATKLLAEAGADVVKIAGWGERGKEMADPAVAARGGLADWWYDGGKRALALDLDRGADQARLVALAQRADLVIDDCPPGWLAERGIDYPELSAGNPALVHASLTPFGRSGPKAAWKGSDLVAAATGGVLSVGGLPDQPLNSWGRQNDNFGGYLTVIAALAARQRVRRGHPGQHIDISLQEVVASSLEQLFFQYWFPDRLAPLPAIAPRQGSLHWAGLYKVVPCRVGSCMITPTPAPGPLLEWMVEDGFDAVQPFVGVPVLELIVRSAELMGVIADWAATKDAATLFPDAQARHIAFGEVQDVPKVAANPQFAFRGFFQDYTWDGPTVRRPGHPARLVGTPPPPLRPPLPVAVAAEDVEAAWDARPDAPVVAAAGNTASNTASTKPLEGITVVDFTWVLAGPFCTRLLGDLGADILKFQTEERATGVNNDNYPYFYCYNRSKRSAGLNMKHPGALDVVRRVIEAADVLIENYSAGVLERWGLGWEQVHAWNPRLIYVTMSGPGQTGPWRDVISYAPTVHALCGLTYLTNPPERRDIGPGFSLNDHGAGYVAGALILEALEARERTGEGQLIDMAQLEVGSYAIGPALLDYFANGTVTEPTGNADAIGDPVPNEVFRGADGRWAAVTVSTDEEWLSLCAVAGLPELAADTKLATVAGRRAARELINEALAAWFAGQDAAPAVEALQAGAVAAGVVADGPLLHADPHLAARGFFGEFAEHPNFGSRPFDRFPAKFSRSSLEPYRPSPTFGDATFEIYASYGGLSDEEVAIGIGEGLFS